MASPPSLPTGPDRLAALPGYGPGVHLMTPEGELPVEWLATGDRLLTRDHGAQPILWIGRARVSRARIAEAPDLAPVEIASGALGPGFPTHPTRLAACARVLLSGFEVELNAGQTEALAEIADLEDGSRIGVPPCVEGTHYTYLVLPMHALVQANGLWAETLLLDRTTTAALGRALPNRLLADPGIRAGHLQSARLCLANWQVVAMRGLPAADALPDLIRRVA